MTNTSATGGFLSPDAVINPLPLEDAAFSDFIQTVIAGITFLPGKNVRPNWQPVPPAQPDINTNWCAFGIEVTKSDTFPYVGHSASVNGAQGADFVLRYEDLSVNCSFYGPNADAYAVAARDGLAVAQNREILYLNGCAFVECGDIKTIPSLINTQWYYRVDMMIRLRREILKAYPVLNVLSSSGTITTGDITVNYNS
jgi:hypothetical protein